MHPEWLAMPLWSADCLYITHYDKLYIYTSKPNKMAALSVHHTVESHNDSMIALLQQYKMKVTYFTAYLYIVIYLIHSL